MSITQITAILALINQINNEEKRVMLVQQLTAENAKSVVTQAILFLEQQDSRIRKMAAHARKAQLIRGK
ncbi:hypothetical protein AB0W38_00375 [Aliarcobacter butzleri]|uniref:hypothetical protein n=1 Tax=Aliarcobacter butzleri TaxID=28197 RepID=UPI00344FABCD